MLEAVATGEIKALWVMATNPAASLPESERVRAALGKLDLFIVSDVLLTNDTIAAGPHLLLPAAAWGEKDGTVTNSERRISRQRAFLQPPGEAMQDWKIMAEIGKRLGFAEAFGWESTAAVFREHAALSAFENEGERFFDIGGVADVTEDGYHDLAPFQWPMRRGETGTARLFADGRYATPDKRACFIPVKEIAAQPLPDGALRLNTGRVRDHWHTLTRTGKKRAAVPACQRNPALPASR